MSTKSAPLRELGVRFFEMRPNGDKYNVTAPASSSMLAGGSDRTAVDLDIVRLGGLVYGVSSADTIARVLRLRHLPRRLVYPLDIVCSALMSAHECATCGGSTPQFRVDGKLPPHRATADILVGPHHEKKKQANSSCQNDVESQLAVAADVGFCITPKVRDKSTNPVKASRSNS